MGIQLLTRPQTPPLLSRDPSRCHTCPPGCPAKVHGRTGSWLSCPMAQALCAGTFQKVPALSPGQRSPLHGESIPGEARLGCSWAQRGWALPGRAGEGLKLRGAWSGTEGAQAAKGVSKGRVSVVTALVPLLPCQEDSGEWGPVHSVSGAGWGMQSSVWGWAPRGGDPRDGCSPARRVWGLPEPRRGSCFPQSRSERQRGEPGGARGACVQGVPAAMEQGPARGQ